MNASEQHDREVRAAKNQALFRAVNEKLRELNQAFSKVTETYAIACECADTTCVRTLHISVDEYLDVRAHPSRFVILAEHVASDVERVVSQTGGHVVVEKNVEVVEPADPAA